MGASKFKLLLILVAATMLPSPSVARAMYAAGGSRTLLADSKAIASSTGGQATSTSTSSGDADVTTVSSASNGGTAAASKSADSGKHVVSTVANGNTTVTFSSVSWEDAPPCKSSPNTVTKDNSGRLWGWENNKSCAYKAPSTEGDSTWEAATPCPESATPTNSVTDKLGRLWGWDSTQKQSCAFKTPSSSRKLLAATKAVASSTGGQATSTSSSSGDADVTTVSSASNGGTAAASKSADSGKHVVSTVANGNTTVTFSSSTEISWEDAPSCKSSPNTVTKDNSGRLWGWENNTSCACKAPTNKDDSLWVSAPPCPSAATPANSVPDQSGRLWGWDNKAKASCAFKGPSSRGRKVLTFGWFAPKLDFLPNIFSRRRDQVPFTGYHDGPSHDSPEQITESPQLNDASNFPSSPASSPHPSPEPKHDNEPGYDDNEPNNNEVQSETVNTNEKNDPERNATGVSGVSVADVTDKHAASQAATESADGDAFAVSQAGVDDHGHVQAQGHVEAKDKDGNVISANVYTTLETIPANETKKGAPSKPNRRLKQAVTPVVPQPVTITSTASPQAANAAGSDLTVTTSKYGSGDNEVECMMVNGAAGQSLKCYKTSATPSENSAPPGVPSETPPVIPSPMPAALITNTPPAAIVQPAPLIPIPGVVSPPSGASPSPLMKDPAVTASLQPVTVTPPASISPVEASPTPAAVPVAASLSTVNTTTPFLNALANSSSAAVPAEASPAPAIGTTNDVSLAVAAPVEPSPVPAVAGGNAASPVVAPYTGTMEPLAHTGDLPEALTVEPPTPTASDTGRTRDFAVSAAGNNSKTIMFGQAWESAPLCSFTPNKRNSVQDTLGRLWWTENGISCAYRNEIGEPLYYIGYVQVKWETAPVCQGTPSSKNSMPDAQGRVWGWVEATLDNCKYITADGKAVLKDSFV